MPELFLSLDWIKLILLSASMTAPFVLLNTAVLAIAGGEASAQAKDSLFWTFSLAIIFTGIVLFGFSGILYVFKKSLFSIFVFMGSLEILLCLVFLIRGKAKK